MDGPQEERKKVFIGMSAYIQNIIFCQKNTQPLSNDFFEAFVYNPASKVESPAGMMSYCHVT